jgi:hypothetical protein
VISLPIAHAISGNKLRDQAQLVGERYGAETADKQ